MRTPYDDEPPLPRRRRRSQPPAPPRPRRTGIPSRAVYHGGQIVAVIHGHGLTLEDLEQARLLATALPDSALMRRAS